MSPPFAPLSQRLFAGSYTAAHAASRAAASRLARVEVGSPNRLRPAPDPDPFRHRRPTPGVIAAFANLGGLVTADELVRLLRDRLDQPVSTVANWIAHRELVSWPDGEGWLLPMFQFDMRRGCLRDGVRPVCSELKRVYDPVELVGWFVSPNTWLDDHWPASELADQPAAVVQAARSDRYVVLGD